MIPDFSAMSNWPLRSAAGGLFTLILGAETTFKYTDHPGPRTQKQRHVADIDKSQHALWALKQADSARPKNV